MVVIPTPSLSTAFLSAPDSVVDGVHPSYLRAASMEKTQGNMLSNIALLERENLSEFVDSTRIETEKDMLTVLEIVHCTRATFCPIPGRVLQL